ncbi:MAG: histidine phosphatase family protein [Proteobacteria bacterium]|nr:histidine phosphatase family protein [Pseudomonadota bacterium]
MRSFFLVRHGEARTVDEEGIIRNYTGGELTEKGIRQAQALRDYFRETKFSAVYASDLQRSLQTAEIVVEGRGMKVKTEPELREFSVGQLEGITISEAIDRFFPAARDIQSPADFRAQFSLQGRFPGGESLAEFEGRVRKAWKRLVSSEGEGGPVLVAAHGGVNRVILADLLGLPMEMEGLARIDQDPAALNLIAYVPREGMPDHGIVRIINYTPYSPTKSDLGLDRFIISMLKGQMPKA